MTYKKIKNAAIYDCPDCDTIPWGDGKDIGNQHTCKCCKNCNGCWEWDGAIWVWRERGMPVKKVDNMIGNKNDITVAIGRRHADDHVYAIVAQGTGRERIAKEYDILEVQWGLFYSQLPDIGYIYDSDDMCDIGSPTALWLLYSCPPTMFYYDGIYGGGESDGGGLVAMPITR